MQLAEYHEMEKSTVALVEPEVRLTRAEGADFLNGLGFKTTKATLATLANRGGGPVFQHFGKRPLYRRQDLLEWAYSKLSAPRRSTSAA